MSNYLPLSVRKILQETGWLENEIAVYASLLDKGAMDLTTISQETSIGISTIQYAIKQLLAKKVITKTMINAKPRYAVSDVGNLKKWVSNYIGHFKQYQETVNEFVEQYDFDPKTFTSKIRFYEGYRGVKQSYRQMLKDCDESKIFAFFSVVEEVGKDLQDFFNQEYTPKRAEAGISIQNIVLDRDKSSNHPILDKASLSESRIIAQEFLPDLNTELNIYGDYVHCMSFDQRSAFAIIINDRQLAMILKTVFSLLWSKSG